LWGVPVSGTAAGRLHWGFFSKWVRPMFRISHQIELSRFGREIASRLRRLAWPLCARRKAAESHGATNEKEADKLNV